MPKKRSTNTAIARRIGALEQKLDALAGRHAPELPAGKLHRAAMRIENFGLTRILAAGAAWLVLITVGSFWFDYITRDEERAARVEEAEFRKLAQVATAWELLLTRAGGDIGKGNAINTIVAAQGQLQGADLSCENIGVVMDGECVDAPQYNEVLLGDDNFWQDDTARNNCDQAGCDTKPYVLWTNFQGAFITDLIAETIRLGQHFDGVIGRNWIVRNAQLPQLFLIGKEPQIDGSVKFTCSNYWFFDSELSWKSVAGFSNATIERSIVVLPSDNAVTPPKEWKFSTFLDSPVTFQRHSLSEAILADFFFPKEKPLDVSPFIEWDLYKNAEFCIAKADLTALWPRIAQRHKERESREISLMEEIVRKASETGEEVDGRLLLAAMGQNEWPRTLEEGYGQLSYDISVAVFRDGRNHPRARPKAYSCKYKYADV